MDANNHRTYYQIFFSFLFQYFEYAKDPANRIYPNIIKYFAITLEYWKNNYKIGWLSKTVVFPVCWATTVLSVELSEGRTNTQTKIVRTKIVLQLLLDPAE